MTHLPQDGEYRIRVSAKIEGMVRNGECDQRDDGCSNSPTHDVYPQAAGGESSCQSTALGQVSLSGSRHKTANLGAVLRPVPNRPLSAAEQTATGIRI